MEMYEVFKDKLNGKKSLPNEPGNIEFKEMIDERVIPNYDHHVVLAEKGDKFYGSTKLNKSAFLRFLLAFTKVFHEILTEKEGAENSKEKLLAIILVDLLELEGIEIEPKKIAQLTAGLFLAIRHLSESDTAEKSDTPKMGFSNN